MKRERYTSVWDAIEDDPAMAQNLKLRSSLMLALKQWIRREGLTQTQAANALGVTQPRISNLINGRIDAFALDILVKMAAAAGLHVSMKVKRAA